MLTCQMPFKAPSAQEEQDSKSRQAIARPVRAWEDLIIVERLCIQIGSEINVSNEEIQVPCQPCRLPAEIQV